MSMGASHRSSRRWWSRFGLEMGRAGGLSVGFRPSLACVVAILLLSVVSGDAEKLGGSPDLKWEQSFRHVFGGTRREVRFELSNRGSAEWSGDLAWRLFQANSATAMPVGPPVELGNRVLKPGESAGFGVAVLIPEVLIGTPFVLVVTSGSDRLGSKTFHAHARAMPESARQAWSGKRVGVIGLAPRLDAGFAEMGVSATPLEEGDLGGLNGRLDVVIVFGGGGSRNRVAEPIGRLLASGADVLEVVPASPDPGGPTPFSVRRKGAARHWRVEIPELEDLAESPVARGQLARWLAAISKKPASELNEPP